MKLAAVFCVYNEEEYIEYAIRSVLPGVEQVVICLGKAPYTSYASVINVASSFPPDETEKIVDRLSQEFPNTINVIKGDWPSQIEHRNEGLRHCIALGADYYFLVDGDEVYRQDHLETIRKTLESHPSIGTFIIKCHTFWRSFRYRIPPEILTWRPRRIFKLTRRKPILRIPFPHRLCFKGINDLNSVGKIYEFPPQEAVFYHFSYARAPQKMKEKLTTFPHAQEILDGWFERVWLKWPSQRQMSNIHPTDPPKFPRAMETDLADLPEVMRKHPYYGLDVIP